MTKWQNDKFHAIPIFRGILLERWLKHSLVCYQGKVVRVHLCDTCESASLIHDMNMINDKDCHTENTERYLTTDWADFLDHEFHEFHELGEPWRLLGNHPDGAFAKKAKNSFNSYNSWSKIINPLIGSICGFITCECILFKTDTGVYEWAEICEWFILLPKFELSEIFFLHFYWRRCIPCVTFASFLLFNFLNHFSTWHFIFVKQKCASVSKKRNRKWMSSAGWRSLRASVANKRTQVFLTNERKSCPSTSCNLWNSERFGDNVCTFARISFFLGIIWSPAFYTVSLQHQNWKRN